MALNAASDLAPGELAPGRDRAGGERPLDRLLLAGGISAATIGPFLVLVLSSVRRSRDRSFGPGGRADRRPGLSQPVAVVPSRWRDRRGRQHCAWVAFKVGALSYGGGFVIIPLMQHDAVVTYHWMTGAQFLNAVALGQITPGPVVQTVAVVGYAAGGVWGGLLAAVVAFAPSFVFIMAGAAHFDRLRTDRGSRPSSSGAGSAVDRRHRRFGIPLGLALWPPMAAGCTGVGGVLVAGVTTGRGPALLAAGAIGAVAVLVGAPS